MNKKIISRVLFLGRSLAWSLLFYVITMMIVNWDELTGPKDPATNSSWVHRSATQKELVPIDVSVEKPESEISIAGKAKTAVVYVQAFLEAIF